MESTPETRERAQVIYDHLLAHPEEHNQRFYGKKTSCGTSMCIAGNAIIAFRPDLVRWEESHGDALILSEWLQDEGKDIHEVAGDLLGLDGFEQSNLFFDFDNESALKKLARVAAGEDFDDLNVPDDDYCDCDACI